jgi:hypothetical protein
MARKVKKDEWAQFRFEMIERDGGRCSNCRRGSADGVVLQVHHNFYIPGRKPWEYEYGDCSLLCKACHAAEHGIIPPIIGWNYLGSDDLGDLVGSCERCGESIRYVFYVGHEGWESMAVGQFCCDDMTETKLASNELESVKRFNQRLDRFINSSRWNEYPDISTIRQKGFGVQIFKIRTGYQVQVEGIRGKATFPTCVDAKTRVFEMIEDGSLERYIRRLRKKNWLY